MKPKRLVDEALLEQVRNLPCLGCASMHPTEALYAIRSGDMAARSHPHHVVSRGAGGHDLACNVMPLCLKHHAEIHSVGRILMCERYRAVHHWFQLTEADRLESQGASA